jgi:hypothetical protein
MGKTPYRRKEGRKKLREGELWEEREGEALLL